MEGLYTQIHNEEEIVVIDYSTVVHGKEFELMKYSLEFISTYEKNSALVLEVIVGVKLSQEILDYFPEYFDKIKRYVKRWASVGFGEIIFKEMLTSKSIPRNAIKNESIEWFETREEALDFLIRK